MIKQVVLCLSALLFLSDLFAQQYPLLLDKQGSFQVTDCVAYTHYDCGYTKTETSANYHKILNIIDVIRRAILF